MIKKLNKLNDLIEGLKVMIATDENIRMIVDDIADRFLNDLEKTLAGDMAMIKGSEIDFKLMIPFDDLYDRADHIWNNPSQYSDYTDDSEDAYYKFLKFLWVVFPDGHEMQLGEYVNDTDH